jgi:hypothetical protein|tara:strand:+ start:821 stop:1798 length:978 start_codon:yes stop_codon:yes gene_type:complete
LNRLYIFLVLVLVTACGGGGGSSTPEPVPTPAPTPAPTPEPTPEPTPAPTGIFEMDSNCPTHIQEAFLDVSEAPGPGESYDMMPRLQVTCVDGELIVNTNSVPHYNFIPMTPNDLVEKDEEWRVPLEPTIDPNGPTNIGYTGSVVLGYMGFTNTGLYIFGPTEAAQPPNQAYGDPVYNNILDDCGGHTAFAYHNHYLNVRCFNPNGLTANPGTDPQPEIVHYSIILGFGPDGFPILGPDEYANNDGVNTVRPESSYQLISGQNPQMYVWDAYEYVEQNNPDIYLDECNGHSHENPHGYQYHYHATEDFPYIYGCIKGDPTKLGGN